jgi:hypothetical protein
MEPIYYVSETEDRIVISHESNKNTVFFSDNFDFILDWAFGPDDTIT